ncbi:hypothetical protein DL766_000988 [Monosporascus sp. MC13-8B]|uniref:DNA mismatch repair proteins mutS family domain-containing protein n=1 Tax=Monosporascus cannonballus TaxID=155416 RepID=A0ABY0H4L2_9PEZI|nr:hypothetical protein DL762_005903 [Monosporascus cannonballus]RYO92692.1 hypothetical protein DL763_004605 [Monosporascus cannonballus]RYP38410.1 hypothetical protein DL766_000988 [Monosporascus sp. MC13-8B]
MYEPSAILIVRTAFPPNPKSNLLAIIEEELAGTPIEPLDRKYWSENSGLEFIQTLAFREDLKAITVAIQGNFYATCSFAAAMKYQPSENTMMVDISTIQSLELIQNLHNAKSKECLFGLLNETVTPMGSRMLRSNILQPSCQVENTLLPRYDALDELTIKEDMFFEVRKALKNFTDVEKLLTKLVIIPSESSIYVSEQAINDVLSVKSFVAAVPPIYEALAAARTDLLTRIRDICRSELVQPVADLITAIINEDAISMKSPLDMRNQRTYAVKVYFLKRLLKKTYKEANEDVYQHVEDINKEYEITAEVKFDSLRQFWLRLRRSDFEDRALPDLLINVVQKGVWIECQTLILVQLNNRITDSHIEAVMLSDKVIQELMDGIRAHVPNLFRVCEGIALLDMIVSFGQLATTRDYVRPEIGTTLALKAARHPICERVCPEALAELSDDADLPQLNPGRFVPNDAFANEQHRFQIITGCNMSGKSTYMRMISLLQVMAQVGCFVPAEYAAFPIIQHLNINEKSLAIIDELGRGTSTRDGLAIALAISEALIQSNALIWFATHFQELAKVLGCRPGVLNLHLSTEITDRDVDIPTMTMLYKISSGAVQERHYGLDLARAIGFPAQFIETAEKVSKALEEQIERKKADSHSRRLGRRRKLILNLHETLTQLRDSDMDDDALGSYMRRLQSEFVARMDEIERDARPVEAESIEEIE